MMRALVMIALFAIGSTASAADIGRLFFTPAERAQLDMARTHKKAPAVAVSDEVVEKPAPQVVTYGGLVRRSDGKSMLWLNDRLLDEKEAFAGLKGRVRSDGAVTLQAPQSNEAIEVKVGQSVELRSGKIAEGRRIDATVKGSAGEKSEPTAPKPASPENKNSVSEKTEKRADSVSSDMMAQTSARADKSRNVDAPK